MYFCPNIVKGYMGGGNMIFPWTFTKIIWLPSMFAPRLEWMDIGLYNPFFTRHFRPKLEINQVAPWSYCPIYYLLIYLNTPYNINSKLPKYFIQRNLEKKNNNFVISVVMKQSLKFNMTQSALLSEMRLLKKSFALKGSTQ